MAVKFGEIAKCNELEHIMIKLKVGKFGAESKCIIQFLTAKCSEAMVVM